MRMKREDLERIAELLGLVIANAADLQDVADAERLQDMLNDALSPSAIIIP